MVLRVTAQYIDVAAAGVAAKGIRCEAQHVEVAGNVDYDEVLRLEAQHVEVGGSKAGTAFSGALRMATNFVQVIRSNDHRGLTGVLGTIGSGLATETLQLGAGSQGPSFVEPENTGKVGTRSSLAGAHLVPGRVLVEDVRADTGQLGTNESTLNEHFIIGFGAGTEISGIKLGDATSTLGVASQGDITGLTVSPAATTDMDIDGTWTNAVTSNIKTPDASSTLAMGVTARPNLFSRAAVSTIALTDAGLPGLFTLQANNTLAITLDVESGIFEPGASSSISLTSVADKTASILSVFAETIIPAMGSVAENNTIDLSASNAIVLTQDETVAGPVVSAAISTMALAQDGVVDLSVFGRTAENTIEFFGFNPESAQPPPHADWDIVISSLRNVAAETPDLAGEPPESELTGFMDEWTQEARLVDTFDADASHTITLSQSLPQPTGKRSVNVENTLSILQFGDTISKRRGVENAISITDEATFERVYSAATAITLVSTVDEGFIPLFAENTLVFDHIVRPNPHELFAESTIVIGQTARASIKNLFASNAIVLSQDNNVLRPYRLSAQSLVAGITDDEFIPPSGPIIPGVLFGLDQEAMVEIKPIRHPSSLIQIADQAVVVRLKVGAIATAGSSLTGLTQQANLSLTGEASTQLNTMFDFAVVNKNTNDATTLLDTIVDDAAFAILRGTSTTDSELTLKHSLGYSLVRDTTRCDYSPFIAESDADTVPPRAALPEGYVPDLGPDVRFRLVYPPFDTGTTVDTLDLRAPEFGNRERLEATRIQRESVGGSLVVYADAMWPKVHSLQMQFAALCQAQARGLLDFIERWLGQEIGIYDYEGRIWKGVILNPDEAVVQDGRENYSATLEIEAERVYQLNRTALSNLGVATVVTQSESFTLSAIGATDEADFVLNPLATASSGLDINDSSGYTRVPGASSATVISASQFATRNSFFYEGASTAMSLGQGGDQVDFDSFGNLVHNWDAENTFPALSTGDPVPSWSDVGSSPVNLTASPSNQPTVRSGILNGRRVIEFRHSGTVQRLTSVSNVPFYHLANNTGTIFIVHIIREVLGGDNEVIMANNTDKIMLGGATATERPVALKSGDGVVTLESPQSVLADDSVQLLVVRRNGNDVSFRRNHVAEVGTTLVTNPAPGDEGVSVGGFTGAGNSIDQDIAQILMYDNVLNDADILVIESLLANRWGV